jgi:hypothetical protein
MPKSVTNKNVSEGSYTFVFRTEGKEKRTKKLSGLGNEGLRADP